MRVAKWEEKEEEWGPVCVGWWRFGQNDGDGDGDYGSDGGGGGGDDDTVAAVVHADCKRGLPRVDNGRPAKDKTQVPKLYANNS